MNASDTIGRLRWFEQQQVWPLVHALGADVVTHNLGMTLTPGSVCFLANNADAYQLQRDRPVWRALTVLYCDGRDTIGEAFSLDARYDERAGDGSFVGAEICGIMRLVRDTAVTMAINPLDGAPLFRMADAKLVNLWHVFRGSVLPMLYSEQYRFPVTRAERVLFQSQMLHQICSAYREAGFL